MNNIARAREMRRNPTESERALWRHLRAKRTGGFKFRRQAPIGEFIADFACLKRQLVIEVDGPGHSRRKGADSARDDWFRAQGFTVLRFTDEDILGNVDSVVAAIRTACDGEGP